MRFLIQYIGRNGKNKGRLTTTQSSIENAHRRAKEFFPECHTYKIGTVSRAGKVTWLN